MTAGQGTKHWQLQMEHRVWFSCIPLPQQGCSNNIQCEQEGIALTTSCSYYMYLEESILVRSFLNFVTYNITGSISTVVCQIFVKVNLLGTL